MQSTRSLETLEGEREGEAGAFGSPLNENLSSDLCKSLQMPSFIKNIKLHYCVPLVP